MNNWKVIPTIVLATVLIFGAGVFTGGMLVDYVKQARPHPGGVKHQAPSGATPGTTTATTVTNASAQAVRPPPPVLNKEFLQRLDVELHLTKEQHEAVQKIINEGQNEMRKVLQDSRLEIREALTQQQQEQFDQLMKRPFHKPIFNTNAPPAMSVFTNAP